jgi:hypothetical protein
MRRLTGLFGLGTLLMCVTLGNGGPLKGRVLALQETVAASGSNNYVNTFKAGERASVTVSGNGASYFGLYVYDAHGNCIALDEGLTRQTMDDVAVEWYPPKNERYAIEVKNLGLLPNSYEMSIR